MSTQDTPAQVVRKPTWVTRAQASLYLGYRRERLMSRIEKGEIRARLNATGRWEVHRQSMEDYKRRQNGKDGKTGPA